MIMDCKKGIVSGIVATIVFFIVSFILEMLYPPRNAWFIQNFPEMMTGNGAMFFFLSMIVLGLAMGIFYDIFRQAISGQGIKKGLKYGIIVFILGGLMFPIMMLGYAPTDIAISEIVFSLINYSIVGIAIEMVYSKM
jgi:uncharacterized membrane protein YagU involved in acid resistance